MAGQQLPVKRVHCSADCCGLDQDIVAVGIFFKHPLDAANLSFDPAQTVHQLLSLILGTGCGLAVTAASGFFLCNIFSRFFSFFCTHLTCFVICFYRFVLSCRILFFQSITSFSFYIPPVGILSRYLLYIISHFSDFIFQYSETATNFHLVPMQYKKEQRNSSYLSFRCSRIFFFCFPSTTLSAPHPRSAPHQIRRE